MKFIVIHNWGEPERAPHKWYNIVQMICIYVYMVRRSHSVYALFSILLQVYTHAYCITTVLQDIAMNAKVEPVVNKREQRLQRR